MSNDTQHDFATRLASVRARITDAERRYGRAPGSVTLLAIGKQQPVEVIAAARAAGLKDIGENYLQEALIKIAALADRDITWHFTGALQSNKTQTVARHFAWVHSIDRLKLAERLSAQRPAELPPLDVCIQVNVGGEAQKAGVAAGETATLAHAIAALPRLRLRGLMCLPPESDEFETQRRYFRMLFDLSRTLRGQGLDIDTLSMGMSADLEAAIAEGATLVRIGSALFGARARAP